jgi:hypothetical protein
VNTPVGLIFLLALAAARAYRNWTAPRTGPTKGRRGQYLNQGLSTRLIFLTLFIFFEFAIGGALYLDNIAPTLSIISIVWLQGLIALAGFIIAEAMVILVIPPWLALCVCRPLGLSLLSRFFLWFTPWIRRRGLEDYAMLLKAMRGVPPAPPAPQNDGIRQKIKRFFLSSRDPQPFIVNGRTVVALVLSREIRGDGVRAERLLRTFDLCPPKMPPMGRFHRFAFEELAWHAAKRGDWPAVQRRIRLGGGRGAPLLKLLAQHYMGRRANPMILWLAFLISPSRRRAFPFVRDATGEGATPTARAEPPGIQESVRTTHFSFLLKAAEGRPISMEEVFRLANRWDGEFTHPKLESMLRRGMELGARDVLGISEKIRESVLDELEEPAIAAEGKIPEEVCDGTKREEPSLVTKLLFRLKNRLYSDIYHLQDLFRVGSGETVPEKDLLDRWETWLALHESASRLHELLGTDEFATLWNGGLRDDVWNGASRIFNATGRRTAYISVIMFRWVADVCELLGDRTGMTENLKNMDICRDQVVWD